MSAPRPLRPSPEDLLVRGRQGTLSASERADLERWLDASPDLRVAFRVGRDIDRLSTVRAGDEEVIARATRQVLARPLAPRAVARRWGVFAGVAAVLAASVALAWPNAVRTFGRLGSGGPGSIVAPSAHAPPAHAGEVSSSGPTAPLLADQAQATNSAAAPTSPARVEPRGLRAGSHVQAHAAVAEGSVVGSESAAVTAANLFRRANAARRAGDFDTARALYAELEGKFPGSEEGRVSRVSLGKLLLAAGRPSEADRLFIGYLSTGGGSLAEEALVGRADSLQQLGRGADERDVWQALLRDFPSTVYAARAAQRLDQLATRRP